jgi:hypothetical protein
MASSEEFSGTSLITGVAQLSHMTPAIAESRLAISSLVSGRIGLVLAGASSAPAVAIHQLNCKRLSPPSCGGGELKGADDEEEALLAVCLAAYRHSPEGRPGSCAQVDVQEPTPHGIGARLLLVRPEAGNDGWA